MKSATVRAASDFACVFFDRLLLCGASEPPRVDILPYEHIPCLAKARSQTTPTHACASSSSNRSSGLASLSGCAATFISLVTIFRYMLASEDDDSTGALDGILLIPMMPTLYTGPYILRGFRLLVMYNPRMRKRWGTFAREPVLVKAMVISCAILEVIGWTAAIVLGVERFVTGRVTS